MPMHLESAPDRTHDALPRERPRYSNERSCGFGAALYNIIINITCKAIPDTVQKALYMYMYIEI